MIKEIVNGQCGDNLNYSLYDNGVLSIQGFGETDNFYEEPIPWNEYQESIKYISISSGVYYIERIAFDWCFNLESIEVDEDNESYTSIDGVLYNKELTSIICYPKNKKDKVYKVPAGIENIDDSLFYGCRHLENVVLSDDIGCIEEFAFGICESLEKVTISKEVMYISGSAFIGCNQLKSINVDQDNENYSSLDGVLFNQNRTKLIKYPLGLKAEDYHIPEGVIRITDGAFDNQYLHTIIIPSSVKSIAGKAFNDYYSKDQLFMVYKHSYALQYVEYHQLNYQIIDE